MERSPVCRGWDHDRQFYRRSLHLLNTQGPLANRCHLSQTELRSQRCRILWYLHCASKIHNDQLHKSCLSTGTGTRRRVSTMSCSGSIDPPILPLRYPCPGHVECIVQGSHCTLYYDCTSLDIVHTNCSLPIYSAQVVDSTATYAYAQRTKSCPSWTLHLVDVPTPTTTSLQLYYLLVFLA